jgi:hypothetical protein
MEQETEFIAYCIEEYKAAENMSGKAVIDLFCQYKVLDYVKSCYAALHTTGSSYIVNDINRYISNQRAAG